MAGHISTLNVRSVEVGDRILLFATPGTLRLNAIPVELRSGVPLALGRLAHYPRAVDEIRRFLNARGSYPLVPLSTPSQTVAAFERALRGGQLQARTVSRARRQRSLETLSQAPTVRKNLAASAAAAKSNAPRTGRPSTPPTNPTGGPKPSAVMAPATIADWPLCKRVVEVLRRAAVKLPGAAGELLDSLSTPLNVALFVDGIEVTAAANLTPYGWAADAVLAAIGFAYAGLAAFSVLQDVYVFVTKTYGATSEADRNAAADALAAAVTTFGILGVIAILHRSSGDEPAPAESSSEGPTAQASDARPSEIRPRPAPAPAPATSPPPASPKVAAAESDALNLQSLDWSRVNSQGETALDHVNLHGVDDLGRVDKMI